MMLLNLDRLRDHNPSPLINFVYVLLQHPPCAEPNLLLIGYQLTTLKPAIIARSSKVNKPLFLQLLAARGLCGVANASVPQQQGVGLPLQDSKLQAATNFNFPQPHIL